MNKTKIGDRCVPNVCENGGSCIDKFENVKCVCKPGFTGDICQIAEACLPNPEAKVVLFFFFLLIFSLKIKYFQINLV